MNVFIFGATGVVGTYVVRQLIDTKTVKKVYLLTRRQTQFSDEDKVSEIIMPNISIEKILDLKINANHFICTIGTTLKKAKSKEKFKYIDHDLAVAFARLAKQEQADSFHVVSSMGSDPNSILFYNKVKGEMEESVKKLELNSLFIYRPSLLLANREEFRLGEKLGVYTAGLFKPLLSKKVGSYLGTSPESLAIKIVTNLPLSESRTQVVEATEI